MVGLDEWLPPAYLGLRLGSGYRNRLTDRAGPHSSLPSFPNKVLKHPMPPDVSNK